MVVDGPWRLLAGLLDRTDRWALESIIYAGQAFGLRLACLSCHIKKKSRFALNIFLDLHISEVFVAIWEVLPRLLNVLF